MTVLIHPTACSPAKIAALQLETGLRAVIGKTYGLLVLPNGKQPAMRNSKPIFYPAFHNNDPFGGNAA